MALILIELFIALVGLLAGFIGFVTFTFYYNFFSAGLLALYSGILACIAFHIHRLHFKNVLRDWYTLEIMDTIKLFGFVGVTIGLMSLGWGVFQQCYYKYPLSPILHTPFILLFWACMTLINGAFLFVSARKYYNMSEENQSLLSHTPTDRRYS